MRDADIQGDAGHQEQMATRRSQHLAHDTLPPLRKQHRRLHLQPLHLLPLLICINYEMLYAASIRLRRIHSSII